MTKLAVRGAVLALAEISDDGHGWIEAVPAVTKSRNGKWYFTITRDDLTTYAASIKGKPLQIPVDYDHEGDVGGSTRAAGWFTGKTKVVLAGEETPRGEDAKQDALWAEVEWTPRAVQEIRDGEFRFTSPVFTFKKRDPSTGLMTEADEIVASTLTNRPHFTQLEPVLAGVVWAPEQGYEKLRERLYHELNPGSPDRVSFWVMDIADGTALVREYDDETTWVVPYTTGDDGEIFIASRSEWVAAEQEWVAAVEASHARNPAARPNPKETPMPIENTVLAKQLGLADDATDEQINEALAAQAAKAGKVDELELKVQALTDAASGDDEARETRIKQLEDELAEQKAQRMVERVKEILVTATREGRIVPASHEALAEQFKGNPEGLEAVIASMPVRKGLIGVPPAAGDDSDPEVSDKARASFTSKDGHAETLPDDDQLRVHARALEIIGKESGYSQAEYIAAYDQADRELAAA